MATHIKAILPNIIAHSDDWKFKLISQWKDVIGGLNERVVLEKIFEDTIVLGVFDSCWLQELYLLSPTLLALINKKLDQPRIKHIRFKKAEVKKQSTHATNNAPVKIHESRPLTTSERKALEIIRDPELRDALSNFLVRCQRERS